MKKRIIASLAAAMVLSIAGTSFAATVNAFSDVAKGHWSYDAVNQLQKDGIIEGAGDGNFFGDRAISRYEMAIIVAKAMTKLDKAVDVKDRELIAKLTAEYSSELDKLGARVDKVEAKVNTLGGFQLTGQFDTRYSSDTHSQSANSNDGKQFYMDLDGALKINDQWTSKFEIEVRKGYHALETNDWENNINRIWVEGKVGQVSVTAGQKWTGIASNIILGGDAEGLDIGIPVTPQINVDVFNYRIDCSIPATTANGTPITDPFGNQLSVTTNNTILHGINLNVDLSKKLNLNLVTGKNNADNDINPNISQWNGVEVGYKLTDNLKATGAYVKTNADSLNKSGIYKLEYKGADCQIPGTYGVFVKYYKMELNGQIAHDDCWGSMPTDAKGFLVGVDYAIGKNVVWSNLYANEKINMSSSTYSNDIRKLIKTEFDFHF